MSNASQQQNSLLTGKLTGKNAKIGLMTRRGPSPNAVFIGIPNDIPCENKQGIIPAEQGNHNPITGTPE